MGILSKLAISVFTLEPSTTATLPGAGSHGTASSTATGMECVPSTLSEPDTKVSFTNTL